MFQKSTQLLYGMTTDIKIQKHQNGKSLLNLRHSVLRGCPVFHETRTQHLDAIKPKFNDVSQVNKTPEKAICSFTDYESDGTGPLNKC